MPPPANRDALDKSYARRQLSGLGFAYGEGGYHRHRLEQIVAFILRHGGGAGGAVLDLGCSSGQVLSRMAQHGQARLFGSDLSGEALRWTRRQVPNAGLVQAAWPATPFADQAFAGVICLEVLGHVAPEARALALAELTRILAPGGWLCLALRLGVAGRDVSEAFVLEQLSRTFRIDEVLYFRGFIMRVVMHGVQRWIARCASIIQKLEPACDPAWSRASPSHWFWTLTDPGYTRWMRGAALGLVKALEGAGYGFLRARWPVRVALGLGELFAGEFSKTNMVVFCRKAPLSAEAQPCQGH